jgi:hypothetical protein
VVSTGITTEKAMTHTTDIATLASSTVTSMQLPKRFKLNMQQGQVRIRYWPAC